MISLIRLIGQIRRIRLKRKIGRIRQINKRVLTEGKSCGIFF